MKSRDAGAAWEAGRRPEASVPAVDVPASAQLTDGGARLKTLILCDAQGRAATAFAKGEVAHFFYEFEVLRDLEVPCGGLELIAGDGRVVHGKNTLQYGSEVPLRVRAGQTVRFHHAIDLQLAVGQYWITLGFASIDAASYVRHRTREPRGERDLAYREFLSGIREHCRVPRVTTLSVRWSGELLHHGVANLPGTCEVTVEDAVRAPSIVTRPAAHERPSTPTIVHVTHWKAGSQWIHKILRTAAPDLVVAPAYGNSQFLRWPLQPGKVYPTVYVTRQEYESVRKPPDTRCLVVIRDLRDTLVSAYFSIRVSHPDEHDWIARHRLALADMTKEEGLLHLLDTFLLECALIQMSWLEGGEPVVRYADLLASDVEILEPLLGERCGLPVSPEQLREAIVANRFDRLTGGRSRGEEDVRAHERKGVAGDWRNHFTDRVKDAFKMRYGGLLVAGGFETDLEW